MKKNINFKDEKNYFEIGKHQIFNVGSGTGYSVSEVLNSIEKQINNKFEIKVTNRRPGDVAKLVASIDKLKNTTGWSPTETLDSMVKSDLTHKL